MSRRRPNGLRRCWFESLEDRRLLAGDVTVRLAAGNLIVTGDGLSNGIEVTSTVTATEVTGIDLDGSATTIHGTSTFAPGSIRNVVINMGGGDDNVKISGLDVSSTMHVNLGDGADTFLIENTSVARSFVLTGGAGHDDLNFGAGNSLAGQHPTPPNPTIRGDSTVDEGSTYTLDLSSSGTTLITEWTIDWGDSVETFSGNPATVTHTYVDGPKNFTISATATTASGTFAAADTVEVEVKNVVPTITDPADKPVDENAEVTLTTTITDPGTLDTFTATVNWDDGAAADASPTLGTTTDFTDTVVGGTKFSWNHTSRVLTYKHTYLDDNPTATPSDPKNVVVTVRDDDSATTASQTTVVTVTNQLPTITDPADKPVDENAEVTLTTTITDPGTLDTFTATVNWDDGAAADASPTLGTTTDFTDTVVGGTKFSWNHTSRVLTYKHTYLDDNPTATPSDPKNVVVTVRDDDSATTASQTTVVTVTNQLPTITDPADKPVDENAEVTLTTTITDPGTLDTFTATVNWDDGAAADASPTLGTTTDFTDTVVGGTKFSWNHTSRVLTYKHTYLDDNPTATPSDPKNVVVTVRDDDSATTASQTTVVTVTNQLPTITDPADKPVDENAEVTLTTTITDPGTLDTFTATVNWDDGAAADASPTLGTTTDFTDTVVGGTKFSWNHTSRVLTYKHTYLDDNPTATPSDPKNVVVTVRDDDSATTASQTTVVTVTNQLPTITDPADKPVDENAEVTLTTTITDPGTLDTFTATVNWDDGAAADASPTLGTTTDFTDTVVGGTKFSWNHTSRVLTYKHTYLDDNPTATPSDPKNVVVTVRDDDSATTASQTTVVTVTNQLPTITDPADKPVDENAEVTLTTTITDPGTLDTFTATVNWDDGAAADASPTLGTTTDFTDTVVGGTKFSWNHTSRVLTYKHTYLDDNPTATPSDPKNVVVTVRDDDSATTASQTTVVTVTNAKPEIADNSLPADLTIDENGTAKITATISDPGTLDVFSVDVDWQDGASDTIPDLGQSLIGTTVEGGTTYTWDPTTRILTLEHQYLDDPATLPDTFAVTLIPHDDDAGIGATQTVTVTVNNADPILSLTNPATESPRTNFTLTGSYKDQGLLDAQTLTITWNVNDPLSVVSTFIIPATNDAAGNQTLTTAYTDTSNGGALAITNVNTTTGQVDFTVTFTYPADDNGVRINVKVEDDDTGSDEETTTAFNVSAPEITDNSLPADITIDENGTAKITATITDPNAQAVFQVDVDWKDGTSDTISNLGASDVTDQATAGGTYSWDHTNRILTLKHQYFDDPPGTPDVFGVTLIPHDDIGGTGATETVSVTVNNADPQLSAPVLTNAVIDEGDVAQVTTILTDPGTLDVFSVDVDWGDGSTTPAITGLNFASNSSIAGDEGYQWTASSHTLVARHKYLDDKATGTDEYTIKLTPHDDDGGTGTPQSTTIEIDNVPPALSAPFTNSPINEGDYAALGTQLTDQGAQDVFSVDVNWGDGSPTDTITGLTYSADDSNTVGGTLYFWYSGSNLLYAYHVYLDDNPSYTVTLTPHDDDGGTGTPLTTNFEVDNVAPILSLTDPATESPRTNFTLTGSYQDQGLLDAQTLTITWNVNDVSSVVSTFNIPAIKDAAGNQTLTTAHTDTSNGGALTITNVDTTTGQVDFAVTFNYAADATGVQIKAKVEDDDTGADEKTTTAFNVSAPEITDNSPTADITIDENGTAKITAKITDPNAQAVFHVDVDWKDGTGDTIPNLGQSDIGSTTVGGTTYTWTALTRVLTLQHQYLDDNPIGTPDVFGVTLIPHDDIGGTGATETVNVTVNNKAPTVTLTPVSDISENDTVSLSGSYADAGRSDGQTLVIDWGDPNYAALSTFAIPAIHAPNGTPLLTTGTINSSTDGAQLTIDTIDATTGTVTFHLAHQYLDDGASPGDGNSTNSVTINATITDDDAQNGTSSATFNVKNVPPQLTPPTPATQSTSEGGTVSLTTTLIDTGTQDDFSLDVVWGDGATDTIKLSVAVDDYGNNAATATPYVVGSAVPGNIEGPYDTDWFSFSATSGVQYTFRTSLASLFDSTLLLLAPDGVTELEYDDDSGGGYSSLISWTAPASDTYFIGVAGYGSNYGTYSLSSATGGGLPGGTTYFWTAATRTLVASHTYLDDPAVVPTDYTVTLTPHDDDGSTGTPQTATVTVNNVVPLNVAINGVPADPVEGTAINMTSSFTDPGSTDTFRYDWRVSTNGIGFGVGNTADFSFTPPDNGSYVVRLRVADDDMSGDFVSGTDGIDFVEMTKTISVGNAKPTATISNNGPLDEESNNVIVSFGNQFDPSPTDTAAGFHYAYDLNNDGTFENGDGTYAGSGTNASVGFGTSADGPGTATVHVRIIDKDGDSTDYFSTIQFNNAAPTVNLTDVAPAPTQNVQFTLTDSSFTDPGQNTDLHTVVITWGDGTSSTFTLPKTSSLVLNSPIPSDAGTAVSTFTAKTINALTGKVTFEATHTYTVTAADIQISASITDDDGGGPNMDATPKFSV